MPPEPVDRLAFDGWGPCFHEPGSKESVERWIRETASEYFEQVRRLHKDGVHGGLTEWLLWSINDFGGAPTCMSDQWTGVSTEGSVWEKSPDPKKMSEVRYAVHTFIQGDTFLIALTETYRIWKELEERVYERGEKISNAIFDKIGDRPSTTKRARK